MRSGLAPLFAAGLLAVAAAGFLTPADVRAGGYKIPEQSSAALALSAAYVAHAQGAAAAYYNPANMVFGADEAETELSLTVVHLPPLRFSGTFKGLPADAQSKEESVLLPNLHYVSRQRKAYRFGFALVFPFGLSKRWDSPLQKLVAEEFTLKTVEIDVAAGFRLNENLSIGGGLRGIYNEGIVKSDGSPSPSSHLTRELKGDAFSPGYYLALSYRPLQNLAMAATYRSEASPELEGNAKLSASGPVNANYDGPAKVEIVLPATAQFATALTYRKAVFEFVYERTYWGRYKTLNFDYDSTLSNPVLIAAFDEPIEKSWSDANAYRFGLSYQYSPATVLMFGFAIDESPIPDETLNFDIPDADAKVYSLGFSHRIGSQARVAAAYLFSDKDKRAVSSAAHGIAGTFESRVHLFNVSLLYFF